MSQFDPFGILEHDDIRRRIADHGPDYAQSDVDGQIVSCDGHEDPGTITAVSALTKSSRR
jgi:hypothetical protein